MAKEGAAVRETRASGPAGPADGLESLPHVAEALGLGVRTVGRYQSLGVIVPARPRQGSRPAGFDRLDCARRIIAYRGQETPRDRRELAQAKLLEQRYKREADELLDRRDVVRRGQGVAKTVAAYLLALPARLVRDGILPPEGEAAADKYLRERLDELARFGDARYLTGATGDAGDE
jgi:hypothetical protein